MKFRDLTDSRAIGRCHAGRVRIEICLDRTDPPQGRVRGGGQEVCFRGWIDLQSALSSLIGTLGEPHGQLDARAQSELGEDV